MNFEEFLNAAIPVLLIVIVVGWIGWKFQKPIGFVVEWVKDTFMSGVDKVQTTYTGTELAYKA